MNFQGVIIGFATFVIIGVFHPIVIWPLFLILGIILIGASLYIQKVAVSAIVGVIGFSCLWSIQEIIEQEERVKKGWFPENPNRIKKNNLNS